MIVRSPRAHEQLQECTTTSRHVQWTSIRLLYFGLYGNLLSGAVLMAGR